MFVESDNLAHFGVKGMKWGVRKERSTSDDASKSSRNKKLAAAAVVGVGLTATAILMARGRNRSTMSLQVELVKKGMLHANKVMKNSGGVKASTIKKPPGKVRISSESQAWLKAFNDKQSQLTRLANEDLKAGYNRNQIPVYLREYLPDW